MERRKEEEIEWGLVWNSNGEKAKKRIISETFNDGKCRAVTWEHNERYLNRDYYNSMIYHNHKPLPESRYMTAIEIMTFISENSNCWLVIKGTFIATRLIEIALNSKRIRINSYWYDIDGVEYTLDYGKTFHEFKIEG